MSAPPRDQRHSGPPTAGILSCGAGSAAPNPQAVGCLSGQYPGYARDMLRATEYTFAVLLPIAWVVVLVFLKHFLLYASRRWAYRFGQDLDALSPGARVTLIASPMIVAAGALLGSYGVNIYGGSPGLGSVLLGWLVGLPIMVLSVLAVGSTLARLLSPLNTRRPDQARAAELTIRKWRHHLADLDAKLSSLGRPMPGEHQQLFATLERCQRVSTLLIKQRSRVPLRYWRPRNRALAAAVGLSTAVNVLYGGIMLSALAYGAVTSDPKIVQTVTEIWPVVAISVAVTISAACVPFIVRRRRRWWLNEIAVEVQNHVDQLRPRLATLEQTRSSSGAKRWILRPWRKH